MLSYTIGARSVTFRSRSLTSPPPLSPLSPSLPLPLCPLSRSLPNSPLTSPLSLTSPFPRPSPLSLSPSIPARPRPSPPPPPPLFPSSTPLSCPPHRDSPKLVPALLTFTPPHYLHQPAVSRPWGGLSRAHPAHPAHPNNHSLLLIVLVLLSLPSNSSLPSYCPPHSPLLLSPLTLYVCAACLTLQKPALVQPYIATTIKSQRYG